MSDLATAIKENTDALRAMTAAFAAMAGVPVKGIDYPNEVIGTYKAAVAAAAPKASPAAGAEPEAAAEELTYERDVKPVGLKLVAHDKEAFNELLKAFGAKKGTDLTPAQWPDFIARAKALLAI